MVTTPQKLTAQAIVNIFETGTVLGEYGKVTLLRGDPGHLTYGRAQTTLASGNLAVLIEQYCSAEGAELAGDLATYLERLRDRDISLDHDSKLKRLLRDAGEDPVMWQVQDDFFDRVYWLPTLKSSAHIGAESPLGLAVVFDSRIHGSWHRLRDRTNQAAGTLADLGEAAWVRAYLQTRRAWLANHSITILNRTVYRMDSLLALVDAENWNLDLPLIVRGHRIDTDTLSGDHAVRASADLSQGRTLRLRTPLMHGLDVEALQLLLRESGIDVEADGVYGPATAAAVQRFQEQHGLVVDGVVGPATLSLLRDDD